MTVNTGTRDYIAASIPRALQQQQQQHEAYSTMITSTGRPAATNPMKPVHSLTGASLSRRACSDNNVNDEIYATLQPAACAVIAGTTNDSLIGSYDR